MKKHFIIAGLLLLIYVVIINGFNALASYHLSQNQIIQEQIITTIAPTTQIAQVSTSLSVSVSRKRWYGKIYEIINNEGEISNLYLLGFLKLPLVNINISYVVFHILFFIALLIYLSILTTIRLIKYKKYKYYYNYM